MLDVDAVRAVTRLIDRGFEAYLVGGCVRDLLLDRTPKDYDIATEARPPQVKRTFPRNCRIIGRRFKLAHLHFHGNTKILECSTFRRTPEENENNDQDDLLITRDNEFGNAEEDALRRDFTINALFLDPTRDLIVDHVNGLEDVEARVIRTIGDPVVRFREDPVRILRAAKFAGRLGFSIEKKTLAAMAETAEDLVRAAPPRVLEEILRLLRSGHALQSFQLLDDVGALKSLMPVVGEFLAVAPAEQRGSFWHLLEALDRYIVGSPRGTEPPQNGVLLATLFFGPVAAQAERSSTRSASSIAEELLGPLASDLRLPRRDSGCLKRVCGVQHRFVQPEEKRRFRVDSFVRSPYFDEALLLFELRTVAAEQDLDVVDQWHKLAGSSMQGPASDTAVDDTGVAREPDEEHDAAIEKAAVEEAAPKRPRRRRRRRKPEDSQANDDDRAPTAKVLDDEHHDEADRDEDATSAVRADESTPADEQDASPGPRKKRRRGGRRRATRTTDDTEPAEVASSEFGSADTMFPVSEEPQPHGDPRERSERVSFADDDRDTFPRDSGADEPEARARGGDQRGSDTIRRRSRSRDDDDDADQRRDARDEHDGHRAQRDDDYDDEREPVASERESDRDARPPEERGDEDRDGDRQDDGPARLPRRRRGRRGRGRASSDRAAEDLNRTDDRPATGEADDELTDDQVAERKAPTRRKVKAKQSSERKRTPRESRDPRKREPRGRGRGKQTGQKGRGGPRDVDVVPRYRDRRGKVEVIEPVSLDLSAFDVELDPKRVPTFGSIVEGKSRPKRRGPRLPDKGSDEYRPPPPPGSIGGPDTPPPPPSSDDSDTFGDW